MNEVVEIEGRPEGRRWVSATGLTTSEWGGGGRDFVSYAIAIEEIAKASATLAVILVVTNSLVLDPILHFGTPSQKQRWRSRLASGELVGAFALSEEHAGSDAANQRTAATMEWHKP